MNNRISDKKAIAEAFFFIFAFNDCVITMYMPRIRDNVETRVNNIVHVSAQFMIKMWHHQLAFLLFTPNNKRFTTLIITFPLLLCTFDKHVTIRKGEANVAFLFTIWGWIFG